MLAGCKFFVMKFCLMNKEKVLRSELAITHVCVVQTAGSSHLEAILVSVHRKTPIFKLGHEICKSNA